MNADKSVAALLYAIVVCVTISRSTNNENSMDDRDDDVRGVMSSRGSVLRQRPRSASIGHLHSASTQQRTNEPSDDRKQRYHVGLFDCGYVSTPFILSLWIMLSSVAKTVFHIKSQLASIMPESCLLIVVGTVMGLILLAAGQTGYALNTATFFVIFLPWIILSAGYFLPLRTVFDNIGVIVMFAVVGTLWNTFAVGLTLWGIGKTGVLVQLAPVHTLVFASLLAAVDPVAILSVLRKVHVNKLLCVVILGESLLNDGMAVMLYRAFDNFSTIGIKYQEVVACLASFAGILFGSPLIGIVFGLSAGLVSRFASHVSVVEPVIVFLFGYMSFLTAEMLRLSGILSCICCAVTMKHYVEPNMSLKSQTAVKYFLKVLSSVCEGIIFMYLGTAVFVNNHQLDLAFVVCTLAVCLVSRIVGILLLSGYANHLHIIKLDYVDQFVMAYGGLRGAMTFALVVLLDENVYTHCRLLVTTTIVVTYVTNFFLGVTIKPLVIYLKAKWGQKQEASSNEKIAFKCFDYMMAGVEGIVGNHHHHWLQDRLSAIDNKYVKPRLTCENTQHRGWSLLNACQSLPDTDSQETLQPSSGFSRPDVLGQDSSSLTQLPFTSALHPCLSCNTMRRCVSDSAFHQCASTSASTQPLPDAGSATCLDLQAIDVHETRKMRDDSKIHHIVDDLVSRPRKLVGHYHHPLPKAELHEVDMMESDEPGHRTAPVYLRHMLSHTQWLQMSQSRAVGPTSQDTSVSPVNGTKSHVSGLKISKSVSFGKVENVLDREICTTNEDDGSQQAEDGDASSVKSDAVECGDDEDIGIVFTVPATASIHEDVGYKAEEEIVPTAVELCLPWRRNTGRAPMSSVETHMVADGCNPVLADGGNWMKGLTHSLSDSQSNSSSQSKCGVYDTLNVTLDEENTDQKTPLCSPHDAALTIHCECSVSSDEKPPDAKVKDVVDLPPHKKTSRHSELQSQLQLPPSGVRLTMHRRPTRCGSVPSFMDSACRAVEQEARLGAAVSLLPWRYTSDERAIPDQQAPRPSVATIARESPSQSFVDAVSTYPQPSCQSFRLSEAESRHSEPVHVQHVIDITSAGHRVASTPSEPDDDQSSDILCNLEELDSHERICMWLDTLSESNDEVPPDVDTVDFDKVS